MPSVRQAPFIVSVAVVRDVQQDIVILDLDSVEIQCVDQIVHVCIDKNMKIWGFEQSKGLTKKQPCGLPAAIFSQTNMRQILRTKVGELA